MKPGDISGIIQLGDRYVILFCEGLTKPENIEPAKVRDLIYEDLREKKERLEMAACFSHLQDTATIDNFLAGKSQSPAKPDSRRPLQPPPADAARSAAAGERVRVKKNRRDARRGKFFYKILVSFFSASQRLCG